jgi:hypothetical protein
MTGHNGEAQALEVWDAHSAQEAAALMTQGSEPNTSM